jgi:hypothetical protein
MKIHQETYINDLPLRRFIKHLLFGIFRNRMFGNMIGKATVKSEMMEMSMAAEGYCAAKSATNLIVVETPMRCTAFYTKAKRSGARKTQ